MRMLIRSTAVKSGNYQLTFYILGKIHRRNSPQLDVGIDNKSTKTNHY